MSLYKPKAVYAASERNTLQQVEKFMCMLVVFTSNGRRSDEVDGWIAKDNAVLHELYRSVVTKRESSTVKLSVFKSSFVPILTYDLESWVMTEMIAYLKCKWQKGIFAMSPWCDTSGQSAQL